MSREWLAIAEKVESVSPGIMKALFLCLMLAALPAFGEHRENPLAPIALYTQFEREPPPAVFDALQHEVDSLMAASGLRFTWRDLRAARGDSVSVELAVISFKGRCDVAGLSPHGSNAGPLGWTHISDGAILPFADIDCQGIRGFIQKQLLAVPVESREEAYGRALGRVLAHELYHIFAKTTRHGAGGAGKSKYTVQDLLSTDFQFDACESLALKTSEAHAALERASLLNGATASIGEHL